MNKSKWIIFFVALAMMAGTAVLLGRMVGNERLSAPGVKISPVSIYDEKKQLISTQSIVLPEQLPGLHGFEMPITAIEVLTLPADTTYGRRGYGSESDHFQTQTSVILMGSDRASLHRPQWCLEGGGWHITSSQISTVPMTRPYPYKLPVNEILMTRQGEHGGTVSGVYVYWYVSKDKITADHLGRLWSATWTALTTGIRERWAYISYFAPCLPGQERATFERLQKVIQDSVPEFQIACGPHDPQSTAMTAAQN